MAVRQVRHERVAVLPRASVLAEARSGSLSARAKSKPKWIEPAAIAVGDLAAIGAATVLFGTWSLTGLILLVAVVLAITVAGEYQRPRINLSALHELPVLLARVSVPLLLGAVDAAIQPVDRWVFRYLVAIAAAVLIGRFVTFWLIRQLRRHDVTRQPVLIVGAGEIGHRLAGDLERRPEYGLRPVGVIDDEPGADGLDLAGSIAEIPLVVERTGARRVILAFGRGHDLELVGVLRRLSAEGVEVYVVPRMFDVGAAAGDRHTEQIWGVPVVWLRRRAGRHLNLRLKRCFDVAVTTTVLVPLLPVIAAVALLVRATSPGPVLFRQRRVGRNGREFDVLKFRSMYVNEDSDTTWTVRTDGRITRVGQFLRRTSLDELPQLFNVLRGDMSLVGPRPERPHFVEQFGRTVPDYVHRHRAPAGLTGWAQVHGLRGDTSIEERVRFDNYYIEHWSMWRDLTVLARSVRAALAGQ